MDCCSFHCVIVIEMHVYEIPKGVLGVELTVRCKQVPPY